MVESPRLWENSCLITRTNTMPETALHRIDIPELKLIHSGKVRDIYEIDEQHMLIVTSDRLSAFDVILPDAIPAKGKVLSQVSRFWFEQTAHIVENHLTGIAVEDVIKDQSIVKQIREQAVVVRRLKALPVEAITRGYIIGSGWKEYQQQGSVCGISLPEGLLQAEKLPESIYTPSTKADVGDHDINISFDETVKLIGQDLAEQVREVSLQIYNFAAEYALQKGIIIADTKFEFGLDENGKLILIDEVLTPDSSRFWPQDSYATGISPPSFDKQYVRDYLETLDWDKTDPGPVLPQEVIQNTALKYQEAAERLLR